jgi:hypothetical protein
VTNRPSFVFLREACAAASVVHPNVASVFHLGRTGENYFYAMEFVEGEPLEHLIRRSWRIEAKLALEIATQVAAGLAAVHEQTSFTPAFYNNISLSGGPPPVRAYIEELLPDVLAGRIQPVHVFDRVIGLEEVRPTLSCREAIRAAVHQWTERVPVWTRSHAGKVP